MCKYLYIVCNLKTLIDWLLNQTVLSETDLLSNAANVTIAN